jgi:hypothetical protein
MVSPAKNNKKQRDADRIMEAWDEHCGCVRAADDLTPGTRWRLCKGGAFRVFMAGWPESGCFSDNVDNSDGDPSNPKNFLHLEIGEDRITGKSVTRMGGCCVPMGFKFLSA